jgi:hypothetical protein
VKNFFLNHPLYDADPDGAGSGTPQSGDQPTPPAPPTGNPQNPPTPPAKTFTQDEVNTIVGERAARAGESAVNKLLEKLGVKTADELTTVVTEAKKAKDAQLSELEKAQAAQKDAEEKAAKAAQDAQVALATANERLMRAAVIAESTAHSFRPESVEDVWLVVDRSKITEKDGSFTGVKEAVDAVAKARPFWLLDSKNTPPNGTPKPKPPVPGNQNNQNPTPQPKGPAIRL